MGLTLKACRSSKHSIAAEAAVFFIMVNFGIWDTLKQNTRQWVGMSGYPVYLSTGTKAAARTSRPSLNTSDRALLGASSLFHWMCTGVKMHG
jgi:hypothetical protein